MTSCVFLYNTRSFFLKKILGEKMAYIQFLAGEYGENKYKYLKNKDKMHCLTKVVSGKKLFVSDIQSIEVANQENCKKAGGTIAGAVAGGLLFGGVGAIVGGMASGNTQETTLIITFKNGGQALAKVDSEMYSIIQTLLFDRNSFEKKHKKKTGLFKILIYCFLAFFVAIIALAMVGENNAKKDSQQVVQQDKKSN